MVFPVSNKIIDEGPSVVSVPYLGAADRPTSVDDQFVKLEAISTPSDRLICLFKSYISLHELPTQEAQAIRSMTLIGAGAGLLWGGLVMSPDLHHEYLRKHNASVFDGQYRGNRHFWDTLLLNIGRRGFKWAVRVSAATTLAGFIGFGSIAYRDRLYLPDWLVSFGALGALSRLWLGSKAILAGTVFGMTAGALGYSYARLTEISTNMTVAEQRSYRHEESSEKRQERRLKLQQLGQAEFHERTAEMDRTVRS